MIDNSGSTQRALSNRSAAKKGLVDSAICTSCEILGFTWPKHIFNHSVNLVIDPENQKPLLLIQ